MPEGDFSRGSPELIEESIDSEPSDEEFAAFPSDGRPPDERGGRQTTEKQDGDQLFEADFETSAAQPEEAPVEDSVDLLGLDSEAPAELLQPPSEMKSSSSNADLLNDLFVGGAPESSESATADLLGGGADLFFSCPSQPSSNTQRASPPTLVTSSTGM